MEFSRTDNRKERFNNVETKRSIKAVLMNSYHRVTEEDGVIVQLVSKMIPNAYNSSASDIHIFQGLFALVYLTLP